MEKKVRFLSLIDIDRVDEVYERFRECPVACDGDESVIVYDENALRHVWTKRHALVKCTCLRDIPL